MGKVYKPEGEEGMKDKLHAVMKNPAGKLIAVDLDGTICEGEFWGDTPPTPILAMIDRLWDLYKRGAHIIIYTARHSRYYAHTHGWLVHHGVPFHGIAMQMKPGADLYIDDKALHISDLV